MPKLSEKCLAAIKQIPIAEVASRYTALKQAGRQFKGLSPLKSEKTPSFVVTPDRNRWHCFSSNKGGDAIDLVREIEHLDFNEAAEALAHRHNIPLEYAGGNDAGQRSLRTELFGIHEVATAFYQEKYAASAEVQKYFNLERGFLSSTAETFQIGFAPTNDRNELAERLLTKFSPQAIRESGLFYAPRGLIQNASQLVPRFSGRLMIPIHDAQGRVCAFSGRQIPGIEDATQAGQQAKYMNSPETEIFKKGQILFNLHRARAALREFAETERFILSEGPLDVMRLWEAGFKLAIAPQGTAITSEQLQQINRYTNGIRCLMDGDDAGAKAALRMIPIALATESDAVFTTMPVKHDPDSVLKGLSPEEAQRRMKAVFASTFTPVQLAVRQLVPPPYENASAQNKARIIREILDMLSHSPSPMAVWFSIQELSKVIKADPQAVWLEYSRKKEFPPAPAKPTGQAPNNHIEGSIEIHE